MRKSDVARLLTYCAAMDNRKVTPDAVDAWHATIGDVSFDDALAAAREHYRENAGVYLTAGHVMAGVRRIRRARLAGWVDPLPQADPGDVNGYLAEIRKARQMAAGGDTREREMPAIETEGME